MSQAPNLMPPIDSSVEEEFVYWDFVNILTNGAVLTTIESVTCVVFSGTDPTPSARLIGSPGVVPSPATGAAACAVAQMVGDMIGGVTYRLQCVVNVSDGQVLSLWSRLLCSTPD